MRKLFYYFMWTWIRIGFFFFYKKFRVEGRQHLPARHKAVIFLPNHQNTFLDALCVAISNTRINHYMARGDIFGSRRIKKMASLINLRPIYRMRDGGVEALGKNEQVFDELIEFLHQKHGVMLHPEGTHSLEYRLRSISKGFTRIAFGALKKYPGLELEIVPVGLNYGHHTKYRSNTTVKYGKPIKVKPYLHMSDRKAATNELRQLVARRIEELTIQIPQQEYDEIHRQLRDKNLDFSRPEEVQPLVDDRQERENGRSHRDHFKPYWFESILYPLVYLNNLPSILIWKKLKPNFKDIAWHGAIKFAIGVFLTPVFYLLQTLLIAWLANWNWALLYLLLSVLSTPILRIGQS